MDVFSPVAGLSELDENGRREYWAALALRHTAGLGVRGACLLLKHFGSAYDAVMNASLWPEAGVPAQKAEGYLNNDWRRRARPEWEASRSLRASIILWTDARYPALLRELPDAPALLYALGDASLLAAPCVAVVGSRDCSGAALDFTSSVAEALSAAGVTVVSGLAFGADGRAHRAALSGPGRTIAVMPGGVDVPFPAGHRELYRGVAERGLIVSETPPGQTPGPGAFPVRNRLISGLSLGVLVTEASHARSGSLITARLAAEQGRNVYVPSPDALRAPFREGTKKLLLDGARPIAQAGDILADLLPHLKHALHEPEPRNPSQRLPDETTAPPKRLVETPHDVAIERRGAPRKKHGEPVLPPEDKTSRARSSLPTMTEEEETILALLRNGPLTQDELLYAAQEKSAAWTSASVSAALMILEVKRLARRLSDSRYEAAI
ncbi:DNA-processing protein DprA [Mailhella sp.]|uniref:DNA-processing protein DprA n=1 Tax=Mailhella sp. TaxID=1981029 RepID=UPI003AB77CC8